MRAEPPIKIHWRPCGQEGSGDAAAFAELCGCAEALGFESVQIPPTADLRDALAVATGTGLKITCLKFRIGAPFETVLSSLFGREMKEAWAILGKRLIFHMSFNAAEATARKGIFIQAGEFLTNCRKLFDPSECPEFDVEGESAETAFLGIKQGDCLWRLPNRPSQVYADALPVLHFGKKVGLLSSVVARETQEEAHDAAAFILTDIGADRPDNSAAWLTPSLWRSDPLAFDRPAALIGSFEEVAAAIHGFKRAGIFQYLVRGGPEGQDIEMFGRNVLPRIRAMEEASAP